MSGLHVLILKIDFAKKHVESSIVGFITNRVSYIDSDVVKPLRYGRQICKNYLRLGDRNT